MVAGMKRVGRSESQPRASAHHADANGREYTFDIADEQLISLSEAAKLRSLPRRRGGRRPHISTLFRWASRGIGGVRLPTLRCGGTLCTSIQAMQWFFEQLTLADQSSLDSCRSSTTTRRSTTARQRAITAAERELEKAGI
jgi:hypothetical protein